MDNTDKEFVTLREKPTGTMKKGGDAIAYLDKTSPDGHLSAHSIVRCMNTEAGNFIYMTRMSV